MKVAIVGSRDYHWNMLGFKPSIKNLYRVGIPDRLNPDFFIEDAVSRLNPEDQVVSGGATGADWWAESSAREYNVGRIIYAAHWDKYGASAGPIRNTKIVNDADVLLAFYSDKSKSRGTKDSVTKARNKGILVFEYDEATQSTPPWLDEWHRSVVDWMEIHERT